MVMISVIMPVFNSEKTVSVAIESILNQSYKDFEFIIIDDGSTDSTENIIKSFSDNRIIYLKNKKNIGSSSSMNIGLKLSKGKYIARMDSDDISLPDRFYQQIAFMENNEDIDFCGSYLETFGYKEEIWCPPERHEQIQVRMFFKNCIYHPTLLMRRKIIDSGFYYDEGRQRVEDYEFLVRILYNFRAANINRVLLKYRNFDNNKLKKYPLVLTEARKINYRQLRNLGIIPTDQEILIHDLYLTKKINLGLKELKECESWGLKLISTNFKQEIYDESAFKYEIAYHWWRLCKFSTHNGLLFWVYYMRSPLTVVKSGTIIQHIGFLLKSIIKYKHK